MLDFPDELDLPEEEFFLPEDLLLEALLEALLEDLLEDLPDELLPEEDLLPFFSFEAA